MFLRQLSFSSKPLCGDYNTMQINRLVRALGLGLCFIALPVSMMADAPVVPELNPSAAVSAVTMLAGLGLILRSRKRK